MDEFNKNPNNSQDGQDGPSDYYYGSGSYYNPPVNNDSKPEENTTYHYAYNRPNDTGNHGNGSVDNQSAWTVSGEIPQKKKKNKTVIILIAVIIVCIALAGAGIYLTSSGALSSGTDDSTQPSSFSASQAELNSSGKTETVDSSGNLTVAGVFEKVADSCAGITVYTNRNSSYNYFYGYGSSDSDGDNSNSASGEGSGVLMLEDSGKTYVLTCAHVISDGDTFTVTLNDGTEYEATIVGYDSQTDIGVLSIEATGLSIAEFGDSDGLVVGEQVVAVGCPGGLEFINSMTSGYISALARPVSSSIGYDTECIQTDAAINPGNSGGALFNMQGQVIGINSSKIAATDYEGMGFSVPSSTAVATANSLIKVGYVEGRAKIGITYTPLTNFNNSSSILSALKELGFSDADGTMVIDSVDSSSDLADKDVQQYDMIVAVNGETLTSTDVLTSILADSSPGDTIQLTIARIENNQIKTSNVECKLIESKG